MPKRDMWEECYSGAYTEAFSPETFRDKFCAECNQVECINAGFSRKSRWARRMDTQVDRLLDNPKFADLEDPVFREIRKVDFPSAVREALRIHVSEKRGDWSVPSEGEVSSAAASLVGLAPPTAFQPPSPPTPEPPAPETATHAQDSEKPEGKWRIKGSSGNIYTITRWPEDRWECTCPSREDPCKHARLVQGKLNRVKPAGGPTVLGGTDIGSTPPQSPPPLPVGVEAPPPIQPKAKNTRLPREGLMVGGGSAPRPDPAPDPWAPPPKPAGRVIPVGGRVTFRKKK